MNKFDVNDLTNCFKMSVDLKGIKKLEEYIKKLEQENNQLKEQRQELRNWLEEVLNELKQNDIYDRTSYGMGQVIATECIIEKLNELEGDKNE